MKKTIAIALGAVLMGGVAAKAEAASYVDFSGYYRAYYMNDVNLGKQPDPDSFTDSYFGNRLYVDLTFTPTDEIQVFWQLSGPDFGRWGNNGSTYSMETNYIYGVINKDFGKFTIGHLDEDLDVYGLASLGYEPSPNPMWTNIGPYDPGKAIDAIRYNYDWDNGFGIMAQFVEVNAFYHDASGYSGGPVHPETWQAMWRSGDDHERYQIEATYKWDGGGAALGLIYDHDYNATDINIDGNAMREIPREGRPHSSKPDWYVNNYLKALYLNPAFMQSWGDFSVHFEAMLGWGDYGTRRENQIPINETTYEADYGGDASGYSFYLDADYNYGPGNVTLSAWWASGTSYDDMVYIDSDGDGKYDLKQSSNSLVSIDQGNFAPLLVAYNASAKGSLSSDQWGRVGTTRLNGSSYNNNGNAVNMANNAFGNYIEYGFYGIGNNGRTDAPQYMTINIDSKYTDGFGIDAGNIDDANDTYLHALKLRGLNTSVDLDNSDYQPSLGAFHDASFYNSRKVSFNNGTSANHWAIALTGNHAFTDDISMHYGLAYLRLNEPNYRVATGGNYNLHYADIDGAVNIDTSSYDNFTYYEQDTDLGFEVDLGFTFQLLDNLSFNTSFGYMFNGDAYKTLRGYSFDQGNTLRTEAQAGDTETAYITSTWDDPEDTYVWYNTLTFSF